MPRTMPEIRFEGFTDAWEQRRLSDIATYTASGLTANDIEENGKFYLFDANSLIGKTNQFSMPKDYITIIKDGAGVGRIRLLPKNTAFLGTMGALTAKDNCDLSYLFAMLCNVDFSKKYSGSTIPHIYFKDYGEESYAFPSRSEQQLIGSYFARLDSLIALHQRKCDKLNDLKKAMLLNMFPRESEDQPRIRFKGFTDAWEQRRLGDFGSVAMCKRIFKDQTTENGDVPFYKIGTFGGEPDAYISRELFDEYKQMYSYPEKGDIMISASGSIGKTVEYKGEDAYYQDSNIVWLKHDNTIVNSFLKHLYDVVQWAGIEGSTIKRLYNDNILKTEVMVPSVQEQEEIGRYFDSLDSLIAIHQHEFEKLQAFKKAMLEKMFI